MAPSATQPCLCEVNYTLPSIQVFEQLNISTSPFTLKLLTIIKQLKSSKAFDPDNIPGFFGKTRSNLSMSPHESSKPLVEEAPLSL